MIIQCPHCAARYRIDPDKVPKDQARAKCPKCASVFQVDLLAGAGAEPAAEAAKTVLVVDDSKFFRELILDVLRPLALTFLTAADGSEALQTIRRERPDVVILDLHLPVKSGYELLREVRADESLKGIRLLAMSGVFRTEADAAEVRLAGADDFLHKSFKPEELRRRVTRLL